MFTVKKELSLDFGVIKDRLEELLEASANFLEREWPREYANVDSAKIVFYTRMRVVINMYATIMWISADIPEDPRRKMLVLSASPLVRTLFEELISLISILHDIPKLIPALILSNYIEIWKEREHAKKYYETDKSWQEYIERLDQNLQDMSVSLGLNANQIANPKKYLKPWPTPGRMISAIDKMYPSSNDIPFMEFVYSWMYRSLSGDTHLNFRGLLRRGSFYATRENKRHFGEDYKEKMKEIFESYKMEMMWTSFTLLLSIISEIEMHFKFGLTDRAKYLWVIFEKHSDMAKEFYDRRYKDLL